MSLNWKEQLQTARVLLIGAGIVVGGFFLPILFAKVTGQWPEAAAARESIADRGPGPRETLLAQLRQFTSESETRTAHGEALFQINCAACHDATGEGSPDYNAPAIAGQYAWYLERQLHHFKDGTRGAHPDDIQGLQMAPVLRLLPDEQAIKDVSAYVSSMRPFHVAATLGADAKKGKDLFVGTCMPCHGQNGEGSAKMNAPRLAGQADWYLFRQLIKFKDGARGGNKKDSMGMQMAVMAKTLMDDESMQHLATYINGLSGDSVSETQAQPVRVAKTSDHGKQLFAVNCLPCHSATAAGDFERSAPALAGQHHWYLTRQLQNFKNGTRGAHPQDEQGLQMAPILRLLPDEQAIEDVVTHIAGLPPFHAPASLEVDPSKGKKVFSTTCMPCHGEDAHGKQLMNAPRLAGQADWYLVRQLSKFKTGVRGAHKEDTSGMQMAAMAKTLLDEETIASIAAYINSLK